MADTPKDPFLAGVPARVHLERVGPLPELDPALEALPRLGFGGGARYRVNDNFVLDCLQPNGTQCDTTLAQKFFEGKVT